MPDTGCARFVCPPVADTGAAGCGDGTRAAGEDCDDRNRASGDGCSDTCQLEPGFSCPPGKPCMPFARCGDGLLASTEQCDDANLNPGDGCSDRCRVESGKRCEGQPSLCSDNPCGDSIRQGIEDCDDGNVQSLDGCSVRCELEAECAGSTCAAICGDGVVSGEDCDDDNLLDGDGCSSGCRVETGFTCSLTTDAAGTPISECFANCGDGLLGAGEECDDGVNDGGYAECGVGCVLGPSCGDLILQLEFGETCDLGPRGDLAVCRACQIVR
jgi:large repetitive protein